MEWKISTEPVEYVSALAAMEARVEAILAGKAEDLAWLLEHPPLFTAGTSSKPEEITNSQGFPVYETGRGGHYTYHGPGQRVGYVVKKLAKQDIRQHVWELEEWVIRTLSALGITGERREGRIGIWVQQGSSEAKIAAIGVRVRKWVAYHGMALNRDPDLSHFGGIIPCGIRDYGVTSLKKLGVDISEQELDALLQKHAM